MRAPRAQMLGLAAMCMTLLDVVSVVGLLPPDWELARRACARGAAGPAPARCAGRVPPRGCAWAGRLCLRGGADEVAHDRDAIARGGKRLRRPDGALDASYVESLHSAMARADAAKLMHVRCSRPTRRWRARLRACGQAGVSAPGLNACKCAR